MCTYEDQDMTKEDLCFQWEPGIPIVEEIVAVETELLNDYIFMDNEANLTDNIDKLTVLSEN